MLKIDIASMAGVYVSSAGARGRGLFSARACAIVRAHGAASRAHPLFLDEGPVERAARVAA